MTNDSDNYSNDNSSQSTSGALNGHHQPYIPASRSLPEITLKACLLGAILSALMSAANAYLGLKVGMTIAATIPAAVISMAVLRLFRNSNILENNIVQTAASAGEAIAGGVAFTLPALIMMGYWTYFPFWVTTCIIMAGGILGVLFSIPLRRAYVIESFLKFPEGIATAEVLKAGDKAAKGSAKDLLNGGMIAAVIKFGQSGLMIFGESLTHWTYKAKTVFGFGTGLSLVLMSAGYIVGIEVGISMLLGGILAWVVATPLYGYLFGVPEATSAYSAAVTIWNSKIRMIGVGTMVVGGIWTLVYLIKPIWSAVQSSIATLKSIKINGSSSIARTERDIPMTWVIVGIFFAMIPLMFIYKYIIDAANFDISPFLYWATLASVTVFTIIVGFLCASIAGYMSGLVGSSNNPISGVTIMAVLSISLFLLALLGTEVDFSTNAVAGLCAAALTIVIGAVIANGAAISSDNLQDLKSGQIVGATPWKQQVMLIVGVIVGAIVMAPVIQILYEAYGIGSVMPREGMDPAQALGAPKAALMAAVSSAVFECSLDWTMFGLGAGLAVIIIILDEILKCRNTLWRLPILGVAIGIYMPLEVTIPIVIGGLVSYIANRRLKTHKIQPKGVAKAQNRGLLFSSGIIAGEALIGIALAVPFAAYQTTECFKIAPAGFESIAIMLGTGLFLSVCYYLYKISSRE